MTHALLALVLCLPSIVLAQSSASADVDFYNTGNDYLRICEASAHGQFSQKAFECTVWVTGLVNGFMAYDAVSHISLFAAPDELQMGQVQKIAVKYMNDHPKRLNEPTAILVLAALIDAYPPKKN